jgi:lysophospholipase L1-like esterase
MADNKTIFWLNVNDHFLQLDGAISQSVMSDYLHPNASQYKVWALAMEPTIVELMNQQ